MIKRRHPKSKQSLTNRLSPFSHDSPTHKVARSYPPESCTPNARANPLIFTIIALVSQQRVRVKASPEPRLRKDLTNRVIDILSECCLPIPRSGEERSPERYSRQASVKGRRRAIRRVRARLQRLYETDDVNVLKCVDGCCIKSLHEEWIPAHDTRDESAKIQVRFTNQPQCQNHGDPEASIERFRGTFCRGEDSSRRGRGGCCIRQWPP